MEFTNPWDCWYTSPGARNLGRCCTRQVRASSERLQGGLNRERAPGASPTESVKWQACPFSTLHPQTWAESKGHSGPSLSQTAANGAIPWGRNATIPPLLLQTGLCLKPQYIWLWFYTHYFPGAGKKKKKKKELEEWKWEVLRDGNSFSSLVNDVNKGKIKLLLVKGPWKGYQATIIKSKLKGHIIHSASLASLRPDRTEYTSEQCGGEGAGCVSQLWGGNDSEVREPTCFSLWHPKC